MINLTDNIDFYNTFIPTFKYESVNDIYTFHYYACYYVRVNHIHTTNFYDTKGNFLYSDSKTHTEEPMIFDIIYLGSETTNDYK